ncbi:MAG: D-alanine--D-alanine ligase family protein [Dongiaceae bacterium]
MTVVPIRSRRRRVAMVHGAVPVDAAPDEQDVLIEVETVRQALEALGFAPVAVPLTLDLEAVRRQLVRVRPAFIFNLVESIEGQGHLIHLAPALFESMNLAFTGAGGEAMYTTSNKPFAKRLLRLNGFLTPDWVEADDSGLPPPPFPGPYIVKSVWEHASIGIDETSVTDDARKLNGIARRRQRRLGGDWFAEAFIEGREFNLGLLAGRDGVELLPPAEMLFVDYPADKRRIVDYAAKWHADSFEFRNTVRRFEFGAQDQPLLAELERIAKTCWRLFGLNGYARVDFRVDGAGRPWVLEVNINPCLSPDAGFAAAAARAGLGLADVIGRIVADLPKRQPAPIPKPAEASAPQSMPVSQHS